MEFYELHPVTPQIRYINKAIEVLKNGGVIIYPTDTVYGFACNIFDTNATERIMNIKNEADDKLFSFVCPDLKDIAQYAKVTDYAYKSMKKLLPGPYTFILPAAKMIPKKLLSKRKTVGIRIPDHPITLTLVAELGHPISSISVTNRKGDIIADPNEIKSLFGTQVDLMLSSGHLNGIPSSVIDFSESEPQIIRQGAGDLSYFA